MKKIISLLLVVLIVLMTGCSAKNDKSDIPAISDKYVSPIYQSMPVRVIVPYSEGGGTDKVARSIMAAAAEDFTKGVAVENITGEGGATGMREGANAEPDGSVITTVTVELTTVPHINSQSGISYEQFKPILMVNSAYSAVTVRADAPWNTLNEFIEYSKANEIKVGNSGTGAIWHLASAALAQAVGTKFTEVPFDSGATEAIASLKNGAVDAVTVSYAEVAEDVVNGNLKVLAVLAPERLEELPDAPTAAELGYGDVVVGTWRGFAVPRDTPDDVVKELSYIISKAAGSMDFVKFMTDSNNTIEILNSDDFYERIKSDDEQFKKLIASLGL